MSNVSTMERLLKRDRALLLLALAAMVGLSAIYTVQGAGVNMSALEMTRMPEGMLMATATWTPAYAVLVFFMWWIMMIAMMLPSAAPVLLLYAALKRRSRDASDPLTMTAVFLLGYLAVWALFSLLATGLQWALEYVGIISGMLSVSNKTLGGVILLLVGLYQFTPFKQTCLTQCQNPVRFVIGSSRTGLVGALRLGMRHGAYCVGCCVGLMLLLFVGGVMNLYWIAGLGIYVLLEKLIPAGRWVSFAAGGGLFASGAALMWQMMVAE
jgi:predicted metal-binding membrane protein